MSHSRTTGKPSVFAPAPHTHNYDSITDKPTEFTPVAHTHSYDSIIGKPTTFTPSTHIHAISDVTNLQSSLNTKADLVGGFVPSSQLPSFVDDVIEASNFSSLPVLGEVGKMYVTIDNNKVFRWSGSVYIQIVASPGSTDEVPEGSANKYFTDSRAIAALSSALSGKANTSHAHSVSDIADLNTYTGFDSRYFTESEVSTLIGGKANTSHIHAASDINSGVFNTARLGTGTASSSTYLRGDGTWATVSAGGTQDLTTTLGYGNLGANWMRLTSDANSSAFSPYTPSLELVSTNYPGLLIKESGSGFGYGQFIGMGADKRLRFIPMINSYSEQINFGTASIVTGISISNNYTGTGIELSNTQSGGKNWNIMSVGSGYGAPLGSLSFYGGDAGYAFTMTKEGNVSIGTGSPTAGYRLDVNGDLAIGSVVNTRAATDLILKRNGVQVAKFTSEEVQIGRGADANGQSVSVGRLSNAFGDENVALGSRTVSTGTFTSIAIGGYSTMATASYAIAIGKLSAATHAGSFVMHDNQPETTYSSDVIGGWKTKFSGGYKFQLGTTSPYTSFELLSAAGYVVRNSGGNVISKLSSGGGFAAGELAVDNAGNGVAMGYVAQNNGWLAIAIGALSNANAAEAIALGRECYVSGGHGVAIGYGSRAEGYNSMAFGLYSKATHSGSYVISDGTAFPAYVSSENDNQFKAAFAGGFKFNSNGTTNLFEIQGDGKIKLSTSTPIYPDNAAAIAGGLATNTVYKTPTGDLKVVF